MKTFEIMYQAAGAGTGKNVQFDVFKPDKSLDTTQSGQGNEIGATGRYYRSFDADGPGWTVEMSDNAGGKAVTYVGQERYDSHGVAGGINAVILAVADVQTAVDAAAAAIAALDTAVGVVDGKVDAVGAEVSVVHGKVDVLDGKADAIGGGVGDLTTAVTGLGTQLTAIDGKINNLTAPPMIG